MIDVPQLIDALRGPIQVARGPFCERIYKQLEQRGVVANAEKLASGMNCSWHPAVCEGGEEDKDLVDVLCSTFRLQRTSETVSQAEMVEFMHDLSLTVDHATFAHWMVQMFRLPPCEQWLAEKELAAWWQEGAF